MNLSAIKKQDLTKLNNLVTRIFFYLENSYFQLSPSHLQFSSDVYNASMDATLKFSKISNYFVLTEKKIKHRIMFKLIAVAAIQ